MMPPKKSLAARTSHKTEETNGEQVNGKDAKATQQEEKSDDEVEPIPEKNIFTDTLVLEGKRKRCIPPSQEMLNKWLSANFEKSKDAELSTNVNITYDHYVTACIAANNTVPVKVEELRKTLFEMFGSSFVVKDDSAYKGVIRVQKKKKRSSASKARADTLKMKDVLRTTFTTLGNPKKGLRFRALQQSIAANFPGLKIEFHPAVLKRALERGSYSGDLECLRGIGACGYYRLRVDGDDDDDEDAKPDKDKHDGSGEGKEVKSEDTKDVESEKKGQTEGSGDGDGGKQEEEKAEKDKTKKKTKQAKQRKTTKHSSKATRRGRPATRKLVHSDPQKVEGCFPMAFTYMSEPKTTSIGKIKKYLVRHYNVQREDKIKDAVKYGVESGYWEQVSGSGFSGKLELTVETFNPCDDRDMCGKIMNAIVASNDPKICSAKLLRNYIVTYHSKFNILEKPFLFKHALERAIHRGTIRQLSGIGASGSYQLTIPFTPNPIILAGKDSEDDYASSEDEITGDTVTVDEVELYRDAYKPRPTKRHGLGRQAATSSAPKPAIHVRQPPTVRRDPPKHRQLQKPSSPKKKSKAAKSQNGLSKKKSHKRAVPQKRGRSPSSSDDDVPEVKGKSSKRAVSQKRGRSPSSSDDDVPEVKGKSSKRAVPQKRGRSPSSSDDDVPEVKGKSSKRAVPQKRGRSPSSSDDEVPEVKGKSSKRAVPQKRGRSPSSSDDEVPEVKGKSSKRAVPQKRGRSPSSSDDDVPEVKGKSSKRAVPQKRGRSPSSSDDDVPEVKGKSSKRAVSQKRGRSPSSSDDDVPEVKGKSSKRAVPQKRDRSPSTSVDSGPTDKRKSRGQSSHVNVEPNSAEDSMSDDGNVETYTPRPTKSRSPTKSHAASPKKTPVSRKMATPRNTNGKQQKKASTDKFASESEDNLSDAGDGESYSPRPTKSRGSSLTPQSTPHKKISLSKRSSSRPVAALDISGEMSDASGDGKVSVQKKKPAARKGGKRRR